MQNKRTITILGIGNTLYSDEGIGVHILPYIEDALGDDSSIEVVEGATDGMRLLGTIDDASKLLIIDAMNGNQPPGTIMKVEDEQIPAYYGIKMSIHQLGFQEVLFAAKIRETLPEKMVMFGVQPASLEFSLALSETVKNQIPRLVEVIVKQVKEWKEEDESAKVY